MAANIEKSSGNPQGNHYGKILQAIGQEQYRLGPRIGKGGFAEVYIAKGIIKGGIFGIKIFHPDEKEFPPSSEFIKELNSLPLPEAKETFATRYLNNLTSNLTDFAREAVLFTELKYPSQHPHIVKYFYFGRDEQQKVTFLVLEYANMGS